ncbi:MAG: hypothetical protein BBJ57_07475 [Desulfobacterales bacterium PC51MH44]|nr:MAG: hypothetical protein BBJ57_07475 [Desulfobacterales bacterium PC51MH44]
MPGVIKETATEGSSFQVTATFFDESGNPVAPTALTWTLTDLDGSIVNSREDVVISTPSSEESILLEGDDLAVDGNDQVQRIVTFVGTYDSATHGNDKPLVDQSSFTIMPIRII